MVQSLLLFLFFIKHFEFFNIAAKASSSNASFSTSTTAYDLRHRRRLRSETHHGDDESVVFISSDINDDKEFILDNHGSDDDIIISSSSDTFPSELYHSQQEPFRSYPCYPKYIHLSQASDMVQNHRDHQWVINMTVSFALDYMSCACAIPSIVYGGPINTTSTSGKPYRLRTGAFGGGFEKIATVPSNSNIPLQFNYTSYKTNGQTYQSDWIYHLPISLLRGGLQTYYYRIVVTEQNNCPKASYSLREQMVNTPNAIHQQQQSRSLRGSNGYYIGETKVYTFTTPPIPGQATTLALVGDLGQTMNSAQTIYHIYTQTAAAAVTDMTYDGIKQTTRMVPSMTSVDDNELDEMPPITQLLIAGDLSYADSDPIRWTTFLQLIEPLVRSIPLHVVAGNHEIECDTQTNNLFVPYEHWFSVPNRIQSAIIEPITKEYKETLWEHSCSAPSVFEGVYNYGNSFYSYQHGLVYVMVLNSYTECTIGSVQYEWLVSKLEQYVANKYRTTTSPWLLIAFHAPLYTTFLGHVNEKQALTMKEALEPIFIQYGVNIVVSGHDHAYMRTYPLAYDKIDTSGQAPIYLTLGAGGNREGHSRGYRNPFGKESWVATRTLDDFGYGHLFVPNATHARFQWVRDRTSDNDFEDIVWLSNPHATASILV